MKNFKLFSVFLLLLIGCDNEGPEGPPGQQGPQGAPGPGAETYRFDAFFGPNNLDYVCEFDSIVDLSNSTIIVYRLLMAEDVLQPLPYKQINQGFVSVYWNYRVSHEDNSVTIKTMLLDGQQFSPWGGEFFTEIDIVVIPL